MLVEFSVANFKSFKDKATLSMVASPDTSLPDNVFEVEGTNLKLLKVAAIYGANASGKSNFIEALSFLKSFAADSFSKLKHDEPISVTPFAFDEVSKNKPTYFSIDFIAFNIRYEYTLELNKTQVIFESLYSFPKKQRRKEYERIWNKNNDSYKYSFGSYFQGEKSSIQQMTRNNCTFLSTAAQANSKYMMPIYFWFYLYIDSIISSPNTKNDSILTHFYLNNRKVELMNLWRQLDLGIVDFGYTEASSQSNDDFVKPIISNDKVTDIVSVNFLFNAIKKVDILSKHILLSDGDEAKTYWINLNQESDGTKKLFALIGKFNLAFAKEATVLLADEFDARLHPALTEHLIRMFNNDENNPGGSQLIFVSHHTTHLRKELFRRDQIWFTNKKRDESTELYSLWDFKALKQENYEKGYLAGRYGAIPILED